MELEECSERETVPKTAADCDDDYDTIANINAYISEYSEKVEEQDEQTDEDVIRDIDRMLASTDYENMTLPVVSKKNRNNESDRELVSSVDELIVNYDEQNDDDEQDCDEAISDKACIVALANANPNDDNSILTALDDNIIYEEVTNIINKSNIAVSNAAPYSLGMSVINNNRLCFIDTADSGNILHIFNGKYWQWLSGESLKQLVYDSLSPSMKLATKGVETLVNNVASYIKREIKKDYNEGRRRFTAKDFADISNHIVFNNCVYDVQHGKKLSHDHRKPYYFKVDCDYVDNEVETPVYDGFKSYATNGDTESMLMFDLMQVYLLMPNRSGKCFFVMSNARDSGKTSFGEFIEGYFPADLTRRFDTDFTGDKFSYTGLDHVVLASCFEMPMKKLSASAAKALKNFTGEGRIEIEQKYKDHFNTAVRFKVLLATNGGLYLPTGEEDEAFYRRAIVIPFVKSVPMNKLDAKLLKKLNKERQYIISNSVRSMTDYMNGKSGIVFPESELSKEMKSKWTGENMWNERIVRRLLVYTADSDDFISKKDIKFIYDHCFCEKFVDYDENVPIKCSKDQLMRIVAAIFPHTKEKRRHYCNFGTGENSLEYGITCVKWSEEALDIIEKGGFDYE